MKLSPQHCGLLIALPALMTCGTLSAQTSLVFDEAALYSNWSTTDANWSGTPNPVAWTQGAMASFDTGDARTLTLSEDLSVFSITQQGSGTHFTFEANQSETMSLTGSGMVVLTSDGTDLTFTAGLKVHLTPSAATTEQIWHNDTDANIQVDAILSGNAGSVTDGVATGGLVKDGGGTLTLTGANTYTGVTQLRQGMVIADHSTALGSSKVQFNGGVLRYGSQSPFGGFASQFLAVASGQSAKLDTDGHNVTLNAGITGAGGLEKLGSGILTLSRGNTYAGPTLVSGGVLRAAQGGGSSNPGAYIANPFGTNSQITIANGASLDVNGNGSGTGNSKTYEVTASGLGANGHATIFNSGSALSNAGMISKLIFNTDISMGGSSRMDLFNILIQGGTNTLYKRGTSELSWISNNASNTVGDIVVEQGTFTLQASNLGSNDYSVVLRTGSTLRAWGTVSLNKKLQSYGNADISLNGSNVSDTSNNEATFTLNNTVTLSGGTTKFTGSTGYRQGVYNQAILGAGNLTLVGSTTSSKVNVDSKQTTSHIFKSSTSNFTGDLLVQNSVLRLSDQSLAAGSGGTLGNSSNKVTLDTGAGDHHTNLDLHGTSQTIGALVSSGAGTARIQNRRAGTTSTLKVGNGNAGGTFAGILEDVSTTFHGKAFSSDGTTGKLAFEKLGTGTQILTGVNTFTGGLQVRAGQLLIGSGNGTTSTAKAGNSAFTVHSSATLGGNGTVGFEGLVSSVQAGGKLSVGTLDGNVSQTLKIAGSLLNAGTLSLDIFAATLGSGESQNSDTLQFLNNSLIDLGGTLEVMDHTNQSESWTTGTWFQLFDWTNVSTESQRQVGFDQWILPTLGAAYAWDTSQLTSQGRIIVAAVPEPTRMTLALIAILGLISKRRRR